MIRNHWKCELESVRHETKHDFSEDDDNSLHVFQRHVYRFALTLFYHIYTVKIELDHMILIRLTLG
jgi:hypothetical protein